MSNSNLQITQSSTLPPAQPSYILRGHTAQIHTVAFSRQNLRLISGDADGWVVIWNVPIKRAVAVWKAHGAAVLGVGSWSDDKIITHGRDNKLLVWQFREDDEGTFSTTLPMDDSKTERKAPWLLHSMDVNALNFCSFAFCLVPSTSESISQDILFAVPGLQDGQINLTLLPSEKRLTTIPAPSTFHSGLLMAVALHYPSGAPGPTVVAGYESGHVCVWSPSTSRSPHTTAMLPYQLISTHKTHTQPVLSLSISSSQDVFYSSSADAFVARHSLSSSSSSDPTVLQTRHAGQQGLCVRDDGKIFATAGWDGRARVYASAPGTAMKELAVLKWHKEGCYALAFAMLHAENIAVVEPAKDGDTTKTSITKRELTVAERRKAKAKDTHWLAAGSKDGKVSLWDIY